MNKKPQSPSIRPADAAKGAAAELRFQQWLSASELPHLYIEQSPLTVPTHLKGKLKRADNLVGIPGVGMIAFDVKAKTIYPDDGLIFDLDEVKKLRRFARLFHLTVFFACLDPDGGNASLWVRLDQLDFVRVSTRAGKQTVACPLDRSYRRHGVQFLRRVPGSGRADLVRALNVSSIGRKVFAKLDLKGCALESPESQPFKHEAQSIIINPIRTVEGQHSPSL